MDLSIDQLLSALQTTQQAKSAVRLSERNVVELVNKLKQLGILGDSLLHTINGREYITTERLKQDIKRALQQAGGRVALVELPALVGVDLVHCERQAKEIVAESSGSVLEAQGELITTQYFDAVAGEINDLLQESGQISAGDLAVQYSLNTELLLSMVSARVGSTIKGRLEGGLLYTPAYLRNIKAQLRGALRGCSVPNTIPTIVKDLGLEGVGTGGAGSVVSSLIDELVKEGALDGTVKAGGINWMPAVHSAAQQQAVASFYSQNGWVGYDTVKRTGITNEKTYLKSSFPDGIPLETAYVGPSLLSQLEAAVEEAVGAGSWLDVGPLLPSVLTSGDATALLSRVPILKKAMEGGASVPSSGAKGTGKGAGAAGSSSSATLGAEGGPGGVLVLAHTCVVSVKMIQELQEKVDSEARQAAEKALTERRNSAVSASASQPGPQAAASKKGAGGSDDDDEDWSAGAKKGKKGGAKAKGGAGSKASKSNTGSSKANASAAPAGITAAQIAEQLLAIQPELEEASNSDHLAKELAQVLLPGAVLAYEHTLQAAFTATAEERRRAKDAISKSFEAVFQNVSLYCRGIEMFADDEQAFTTLARHMVRTTGGECVDLLYKWAKAEYVQDDSGQQQQQVGDQRAPLSAAERTQAAKAAPADVAASLGKAADVINSTDLKEVETTLEQCASQVGLRLKKLEKKTEKAAVAAARHKLLEALSSEQDPASALALVVPLLFIKAAGKLIILPGKAIASVLDKVKDQLPPEAFQAVEKFHKEVVEYLKAHSSSAPDAARLLEQLSQQLPTIKALVGLGGAGGGAEEAVDPTAADAGEQ